MQRLSGLDSLFLSLESQTNLFQVGAVAVLDPSTAPAGSPPPYESMRQILENRLHLLPPFRRRLVTVPGGFDHPRWVEDQPPDLDRHLRHGAVPNPGGEAEIARYAAEVMSRPLDRSRPLWEMHVVEGLEGGLVAGVSKLHHSAIDGIAGTEVTGLLMDLSPEVAQFDPPDELDQLESAPSPWSLLLGSVSSAGRRAIPTARTAAHLLMASARIRGRNRQFDTVRPPGFFRGPRTSLAGRVGAQRSVGLAQVHREDVEEVRRATNATVNDVILALTGAALRAHLEEAGELPAEPLAAFVPISVRSETDTPESGVNRLSGMLVSLETSVCDPVVRLLAVSESARSAKDQSQVLGPDVLGSLAELAVPALLGPAGLLSRVTGLTTRRPPFSVVVSSFPGPPVPLYCGGAELVAFHPFGPVIDGAALNVTAMSYRDRIGFGLIACADAVGDVDVLADRIPEAMRELQKAVAACKPRGRRGPAVPARRTGQRQASPEKASS
ncbi:MAG TPA: wax ester/triacylglycerol synthase family O-acyltransferase [Acidimicrobiales bacterium]|nr:wax ester/triacylglycerol synthase family O-acyltransferase [Acidimicrobiales bacterium]